MWVPLASRIGSDYDDCWAKEFDKVPACSRDGEQIIVVGDVAKNFQCGVVLEE
jgi:hypothetical protein